jgi:hypothetical protein
MEQYYILNGKEPVPCRDPSAWSTWYCRPANRVVAQTVVGQKMVSTVFLGIDHNFLGYGPPILFETMVFAALEDDEVCDDDLGQRRYCTWEEAEAGHHDVVSSLSRMADLGDGSPGGDCT